MITQRAKQPTLEPDAVRDFPLRLDFESGARIHIDRVQPFIILHRKPDKGRSRVAEAIAVASGVYCLQPSAGCREADESLRSVYRAIASRFDQFLIIQVGESTPVEPSTSDAPELPLLALQLSHSPDKNIVAAVNRIAACLRKVDLKYRRTAVDTSAVRSACWQQQDSMPIHDSAGLLRLIIPSVYRDAETGMLFPELLEAITAAAYDALLQGVFAFARAADLETPPHYRGFGRSVIQKAVKHIDRGIDSICQSFDFLLSVTPINTEQCWHRFKASGFEVSPQFRYRPLSISTDDIKRKLHAIDVDIIEDPVLIDIFREKQRELDHRLTMLQLRETPKFKQASVLVYGDVPDYEYAEAIDLLGLLADRPAPTPRTDQCHDCHSVRAAALDMIKSYRRQFADFRPRVLIRDDLPAGLMVSAGDLLISRHTKISDHRLHAVLCHEVGVHLVTYFAGAAQPLRIFETGLSGYEGIQEGLGVFAEYVCGNLTDTRLRILAARVIACRSMLDGASFVETFRILEDSCGILPRAAFHVAMRTYRSGGLAKDAIYLRGFSTVLEILHSGRDLDVFWLGKIAPHHANAVTELVHRELLTETPVCPQFMSEPMALKRIKQARERGSVGSLITV